MAEILHRDKAPVKMDWFQDQWQHYNHNNTNPLVAQTDSTNLPVEHGSIIGSGNYIVSVGLGSPTKYLLLELHIRSDLTWTQCKPCASCYHQKDPIFLSLSCKATCLVTSETLLMGFAIYILKFFHWPIMLKRRKKLFITLLYDKMLLSKLKILLRRRVIGLQ